MPAVTRVNFALGGQLGAAAITAKRMACVEQFLYGAGIGVVALALPQYFTVPAQAVRLQAVEDAVGSTGDFTWWVQIFHAQQPTAAVVAGIEKTGESTYERAQV